MMAPAWMLIAGEGHVGFTNKDNTAIHVGTVMQGWYAHHNKVSALNLS